MPRELTQEEVQSFRERLCEAFTKRFAEHGYPAVTMRALAEDIGCSPMTPYRYFADKDEIFAAARAAGFRRMLDRMHFALENITDPIEKVRVACQEYLKFAQTHADLYRLMYTTLQPDPEKYPELQGEIERARKIITDLADGVPELQNSAVRPAAIAHAYWAALHGVIQIQHANAYGEDTNFDEVVSVLMRVLIEGARGLFAPEQEAHTSEDRSDAS